PDDGSGLDRLPSDRALAPLEPEPRPRSRHPGPSPALPPRLRRHVPARLGRPLRLGDRLLLRQARERDLPPRHPLDREQGPDGGGRGALATLLGENRSRWVKFFVGSARGAGKLPPTSSGRGSILGALRFAGWRRTLAAWIDAPRRPCAIPNRSGPSTMRSSTPAA